MRIALAGAGTISLVHAMASVASGASIVAVASRTPEHAAERARQAGADVVTYDDLPAGADAVVVCTPPDTHSTIALAAVERGAAVLVETPIAATLVEADALVAAGGRIVYGENLVFSPVVVRSVELARSIGSLGYVEVRALSPRPADAARFDPARGAGVLFELGVHPIAVALLLAGADDPISVTASLSNGEGLALDDLAVATIEFASGLRARIEASWRSPDLVWDLQASSDTGVVRSELLPTASIEHDGDPVALPAMREDLDPRLAHLGFIEEHLALAGLVAGRPIDVAGVVIDAAFGRRVLEIVCAASASARDGSVPIELPFAGPRDRTPRQLRDAI